MVTHGYNDRIKDGFDRLAGRNRLAPSPT